jgi:uncharacterized protein (TIGR02246 family)
MRRIVVLVFALSLLPASLAAQRAPGVGLLQAAEAREAQYAEGVLEEIRPQLEIWRSAWDAAADEDFAELYTYDAIFIFGEEAIVGQESIRSYFSEIAPKVSNMTLSFSDFRASGVIATMIGRYSYRVRIDGRVGNRIESTFMAAFVRRGDTWVIRSQIFRTPFPESTAGQP